MDDALVLLVDIGNSFAKFGVFAANGKIEQSFRMPVSDALDTKSIEPYFENRKKGVKVLISSVGSDVALKRLTFFLSQQEHVSMHRVASSGECCGIKNCYDEPKTLGADRWCAMIGARQLTANSFCVVDVGSAVTMDYVSANGCFRGGMIIPGWKSWASALRQDMGLIIESDHMGIAAGCSTEGAVVAGYVNAIAGAIRQLIKQFTRTEKHKPLIFLTGGGAEVIAKVVDFPYRHEPQLVLHGLATIGKTL